MPGGASLANLGYTPKLAKFLRVGLSPFSTRDTSVQKSWFSMGRNSGDTFRSLWTEFQRAGVTELISVQTVRY